jgi:hypothetical protein
VTRRLICHPLHASYYLRYFAPLKKKTYVALRAAEDGGRTQHEGQQRVRVKLVNILCENKLNSEYIHHTQLLVPLPRDRFPTNIHIYYHIGFLGMCSGLVWLHSNPPQSMLIGRDYTIDLSSSKQVMNVRV